MMEYRAINLSTGLPGDGTEQIAAALNLLADDGWRLHTVLQEPNWPLRAILEREQADGNLYRIEQVATFSDEAKVVAESTDFADAKRIWESLLAQVDAHIAKHGQMTPPQRMRLRRLPDGQVLVSLNWPAGVQ